MKLTQYTYALKREVMDAMKGIFDSSYPDEQLRNRVNVTLDYPLEEIRYPAIYITYAEGPIHNMGIGHYELTDETSSKYYHWWFEGNLVFHVMALSPVDRDMLAAGLLNILAFKVAPEWSNFHEDLEDADWIVLHPNTDYVTPGGQAETTAPWEDTDQQVYASSYSIAIGGEFYSDAVTGELIQISRIDSYGYLVGDTPPAGADDPAPWSVTQEEFTPPILSVTGGGTGGGGGFGGASRFQDLTDVEWPPTDGQGFVYDQTSGLMIPASLVDDTELNAHSADTTAIHGIADTSALVLTSDARLTDSRTPLAHKATHVNGGSDALSAPLNAAATAIAARRTTPYYLPGGWYAFDNAQSENAGSGMQGGLTQAVPFQVFETHRFVGIGIVTFGTVQAGALYRLGIFRDDSVTGTLAWTFLLDAGTLDLGAGVGRMKITIDITLSPGLYWLAGRSEGTLAGTNSIRRMLGTSYTQGYVMAAFPTQWETRASGWRRNIVGSWVNLTPVLSDWTVVLDNPWIGLQSE
jgi:hypothetical protein